MPENELKIVKHEKYNTSLNSEKLTNCLKMFKKVIKLLQWSAASPYSKSTTVFNPGILSIMVHQAD